MSRLLTSVDERTVTKVVRQELPDIAVSCIRFHKARADRCVAEVNDQLILKFPLLLFFASTLLYMMQLWLNISN